MAALSSKPKTPKQPQAKWTGPSGSSKPRSTRAAAAKASSKKLTLAKLAAYVLRALLKKPQKKPSACSDALWSHTRPVQRASKSTASISKMVQASKQNCTLRCWLIAKQAVSLLSALPRAAWISKKWQPPHQRKSFPSQLILRQGTKPSTVAASLSRSASRARRSNNAFH